MSGAAGGPRPAGPRDVDRLAALFTLGVAHHAELGPAWRARSPEELEDAARTWLRGRLAASEARVLCWEGEGQLLGLCAARLARRPELFEEMARGAIDFLVVRPEARRRGVGRGLVAAASAWLREAGATRLEISVARGNREGAAFWRALGFAPAMDVLDRPL